MEQTVLECAEQANDLADKFRSGTWTDEQTAGELASRMRRSDCPPVVLSEFIQASGRELPFWEVCDMAVSVVGEKTDTDFGTWLRQLPVTKNISSPEIRKVLAEIRKHYAQDLTVSRMAAEAHLHIQIPAQLKPSETIDVKDLRLTIEMETGTGKTECSCLTTVVAAIKLSTIDKSSFIVALYLISSLWLLTVTLAEHLILKT